MRGKAWHLHERNPQNPGAWELWRLEITESNTDPPLSTDHRILDTSKDGIPPLPGQPLPVPELPFQEGIGNGLEPTPMQFLPCLSLTHLGALWGLTLALLLIQPSAFPGMFCPILLDPEGRKELSARDQE